MGDAFVILSDCQNLVKTAVINFYELRQEAENFKISVREDTGVTYVR